MQPILRQMETKAEHYCGEAGETVKWNAAEYAKFEAECKARAAADKERRRALGEQVDWQIGLQAAVVCPIEPHHTAYNPPTKTDEFLISRHIRDPIDLWTVGGWRIERKVQLTNFLSQPFYAWKHTGHTGHFLTVQDAARFLAAGRKICWRRATQDDFNGLGGNLVAYDKGYNWDEGRDWDAFRSEEEKG